MPTCALTPPPTGATFSTEAFSPVEGGCRGISSFKQRWLALGPGRVKGPVPKGAILGPPWPVNQRSAKKESTTRQQLRSAENLSKQV